MSKRKFESLLWQAVQCYWSGDDGFQYENLLDQLALDCTDEQWQIADDTLSLMEDTGYIIAEMPIETPTSPFKPF